jgi:hypothetical protein
MSPKKRKTKPVTEQEAASYLRKAEEFYLTMSEAYRARRWNSAGLAGVHCAISATDAALGKRARLRSSGENHYEAVELVRAHFKDAGPQVQRLIRILGEKSHVEYDSRGFTEPEAAAVVKDVGRYLEWAKGFFPL